MKSFYPSYIRAYKKSAQDAFENGGFYQTISQFALIITTKANELSKRAALNPRIDKKKLATEMLYIGEIYVLKYDGMIRQSMRTK